MNNRTILLVSALAVALLMSVSHSPKLKANEVFQGLDFGEVRLIDLRGAKVNPSDWSASRRKDMTEQVRDWLLYSILAMRAKDSVELADITYQTSPVRRSYSTALNSYEYGELRTAHIGNNELVLLAPHGQSANERHDAIAKTADRYVVELGQRPSRIYVFEYCINLENLTDSLDVEQLQILEMLNQVFRSSAVNELVSVPDFAALQLVKSIESETIFSPTFGWVERKIDGLPALEDFLKETDDLIGAEDSGNGLLLFGRKYLSRTFGQVSVEYVATLFQAYKNIEAEERRERRRREELVKQWSVREVREATSLPQYVRAALIEYFQTGQTAVAQSDLGVVRDAANLIRDRNIEFLGEFDSRWGSCDWQELKLRVRELRHSSAANLDERNFVRRFDEYNTYRDSSSEPKQSLQRGSIGFSLDTDYDYDVLDGLFENYLIHGDPVIVDALNQFVDPIREDIAASSAELMLCILEAAQSVGNRELANRVNSALLDPAAYQLARYDGGIAGTEVGQILFITDLLAKLLDMDFSKVFQSYFGSTEVLGWRPSTYSQVPKIYHKQQEELPGTRIWFGFRDDAFRAAGSILAFKPISARVFARSQSALAKDEETQPTYLSAQFVDWFNEHYNFVATAEHHYDRLNQLMKWSYLLDTSKARRLGFLANVSVRRELWFPTWIGTKAGLGDTPGWTDCFYPPGRYRDDVETLFVFHVGWLWQIGEKELEPDGERWCNGGAVDDVGRFWSIRGGVSLPRPTRVHVPATRDLAGDRPLLRRANVRSEVRTGGDAVRIETHPEYDAIRSIEIENPTADGVRVRRSVRAVELEFVDGKPEWGPRNEPVYQRGHRAEIAKLPWEEGISQLPGRRGFVIETKLGDDPVAHTRIRTDGNRIRIVQEPGTVEVANTVALAVENLPPTRWGSALAQHAQVSKVVTLSDHQVLIQMREGGGWARLTYESNATKDLTDGETFRASEYHGFLDDPAKQDIVSVKILPEQEAMTRIAELGDLTIGRHVRENGSLALDIRGPPPPPPPSGAVPLSSGTPDGPRRGSYDPANDQFLLVGKHDTDQLKKDLEEIQRTQPDPPHDFFVLQPAMEGVSLGRVRELREAVHELLEDGLGNSERLVTHAGKVRDSYIDAIRQAHASGQLRRTRTLIDDFRDDFRPTAQQARELAVIEGSLLDYPVAPEMARIFINAKDFPLEAAQLIERRAATDLPGAQTLLKDAQYLAAQERLFAEGGDLKLDRTWRSDSPELTAHHITTSIGVRKANSKDFTDSKYLVDERLRRAGWPPATEDAGTNVWLLKIPDPDGLVGRSFAEFEVDAVALGTVGRFTRGEPFTADVSKTTVDYEEFIRKLSVATSSGRLPPTQEIVPTSEDTLGSYLELLSSGGRDDEDSSPGSGICTFLSNEVQGNPNDA